MTRDPTPLAILWSEQLYLTSKRPGGTRGPGCGCICGRGRVSGREGGDGGWRRRGSRSIRGRRLGWGSGRCPGGNACRGRFCGRRQSTHGRGEGGRKETQNVDSNEAVKAHQTYRGYEYDNSQHIKKPGSLVVTHRSISFLVAVLCQAQDNRFVRESPVR